MPKRSTQEDNLGYTYRLLKRYAEAIPHYQEVLRIQQDPLGDHVDTASTHHNLGYTYEMLKRYDEAIPHYQESLRIKEQVLGAYHADTQWSRKRLAEVQRKVRRR